MISLNDIQEQTNDLSAKDREGLITYLIKGLKNPPKSPSDQEIMIREQEMDSGEVETVSFDQFVTQARKR